MAKSKKELYAEVSNNVIGLLKANKVNDKLLEEVQKAIDASLKPGVFGANAVDINTVTKKDGSGKIVEIQCNVSGKWLPASVDYFYEDLSGKSKIVVDGVALKRLSRQAEAVRKKFQQNQIKEEQKVTQEAIDGKIDAPTLAKKIRAIREAKPDFSSVRA